MLGNIWLKIKVFFFISSVLALISFLYFNLFDKLVTDINFQQGADNSFHYLEQRVKNAQYELITNSFELAARLTINIDKKTRQLSVDTKNAEKGTLFAVLDGAGMLIAGNFQSLTSMAGIPAVDRAIKEGVASDGMLRLGNDEFLMGVVPFNADLGLDRSKRMMVVSLVPLREAFSSLRVPFPAQVYSNGTLVSEFNKDALMTLISGEAQTKIQSAVESILAGGGDQTISRWHRIVSFTMPSDIRSSGKIVFIGFLSTVPGYDVYNKSVLYIGVYAFIMIFITLVFTFIITYDVDRGFKKLAADISRLKVGEKLMLHKYAHGAGLVVSALNHMIGNYQKHGGDDGAGAMLSSLMTDAKEEVETEIPEPSFDKKREATPMSTPVEQKAPPRNNGNTDPKAQRPAPTKPNAVDEQKAPVAGPVVETSTPSVSAQDPYVELWETYRNIKIKNGEKVPEQEKAVFLAKLKTNRVSIMTKYNCKDVTFAIEEKEGKPVIKAKPLK